MPLLHRSAEQCMHCVNPIQSVEKMAALQQLLVCFGIAHPDCCIETCRGSKRPGHCSAYYLHDPHLRIGIAATFHYIFTARSTDLPVPDSWKLDGKALLCKISLCCGLLLWRHEKNPKPETVLAIRICPKIPPPSPRNGYKGG
eukprot:136549-Pelagomonas_calceolata.AAC.2